MEPGHGTKRASIVRVLEKNGNQKAVKNGNVHNESPKVCRRAGGAGLTDIEAEEPDLKPSDREIKKKHTRFFESLGQLRKGRRGSERIEYYECTIDDEPPAIMLGDSSSDSSSSVAIRSRGSSGFINEFSVSDSYGLYSGWVSQFCERHKMLMRVPLEFLSDNFSMQGLDLIFRRKYRNLQAVLADRPSQMLQEGQITEEDVISLYLRVHQRYVLSMDGLIRAKSKMRQGEYGVCLRDLCRKSPLLPVQNSQLGATNCLGYCMKCGKVFISENLKRPEIVSEAKDDNFGLAFGQSFPEIFLMNFPELRIQDEPERYVPRVFGFRLATKRPDPIPESPPRPCSEEDDSKTHGVRKKDSGSLDNMDSSSQPKRSRTDGRP